MTREKGILAIAVAAVLSVSLMAQSQAPSGQQPQTPSTQRSQTMSMPDMMRSCQEHCQSTSNTIEQLSRTIDDAKASNDPAKMRAALDQAQKPLADMKQHMTGCMSMVSMMQKMHQK
jgi:peptidoglycan hydrolase CwlO-like protein